MYLKSKVKCRYKFKISMKYDDDNDHFDICTGMANDMNFLMNCF